jgi:hypothetical protein
VGIPVIRVPKFLGITLIVIALAAIFVWKAQQNYQHQDYINSNFFSFWLSGHMVWTGQSPYNASEFKAGFDAAGATYRPSKILQYPLPLMYFLAPVGALPVGAGYFAWLLIVQAGIALSVFLLLQRAHAAAWLVLPLMVFLEFFGPVYLTLQIGSVGIISLLAVTLAILWLESGHPFWAGIALALTLLKPPQALTLLALAGIWFIIRGQWKAIAGLAAGGLTLVAVWLLRDSQGLIKFRGSSDFLLGHSLGVQSNVFSFAYLACGRNQGCMWVAGSIAAVAILALGAYMLWLNRRRWTDWQAFNIIIPLGFLTALYLWSYDQLLYIIPLVWIATQLLTRPRRYGLVTAFLVLVDVVAFVALGVQANTQLDLASLMTTVLVLGMCLWLQRRSDPDAALGRASAPA